MIDYWPGEDTVLCLEIVRRGRVIYYDPRVLVYHHRRELFGPHLRQVGRYALHRGFFARRFPATSLRIVYMLPSVFLLGLLAGALAAAAFPALRVWYFAAVLLYLALTGLSCISLETLLSSGKIPFTAWILTWMGVVATHVVYGFRFMVGLAARRMPEDVRAFDHVSEVEP